MRRKKGRKYNNDKPEYKGIKFDSKKEMNRYIELEDDFMRGKISKLQLQKPYVLVAKQKDPEGNAIREVKYIADFVYEKNGQTIVEDVKGYRGGVPYNVFKIKKKLLYERFGIWIKEV